MSRPVVPTFALADGLTREFLLHHRVCPYARRDDGAVIVAVAPDAATDALDDVALAYRALVLSEETHADEVNVLIERLTARSESNIDFGVDGSMTALGSTAFDEDLATDVRDLANQPPVVRFLNLLVRDAHDAGASDIHLESTRRGLSVRLRLDGVLTPAASPPGKLHNAVVSRIKLLAELDIAERRRPQDGRIRVRLESRDLDLRVSTVPTMHGESVVLRLLDRGGRPVELGELGMNAEILESVRHLAAQPHGLLLVTGPTGSGKTTTLYACLVARDSTAEKIVTVEDPVEYQLPGITQVPIQRQAGVTFPTALRSILRQDPDVIMIGEMRDQETAEIAVQSSMTGHLVFSTIHTNDAMGVLPRLIDLGVPEYLLAATVEGVLAQRLVRRICEQCRQTYSPKSEHVALLAGSPTARTRYQRGGGCAACRGTGFKGRIGVFELMLMNDDLKDAVLRRESRAALRAIAERAGMQPLRADAWMKVEEGLTTVEEVLRVVRD